MSKKENSKVKSIVNIKQNVKGITLIALVVTIVILLILATVTINLAVGQNGLFGRAKNAVNAYKIAEANESQGLSEIADEMDIASGKQVIKDVSFANAQNRDPATSTTVAKVTIGSDTVYVPAKFKISSDSATSVSNGIVIEDASGNQYVWIPVANVDTDYVRKDFEKQSGSYSDYSETKPSDEVASITTYKGYYIGRYEAGITSERTTIGDQTKMTMADLGEVLEKKSPSYTYVTRDQAKSLSEEISSHYGYSVTSKLCSSYAWDTALTFIDKTVSNYSTNSTQGNYYDLSFTYKDMSGTTQTKAANTGIGTLIPTGATTAVCNIYDMGGNVWEWTTEACSSPDSPCVLRGGGFSGTSSDVPAGGRSYGAGTTSSGYYVSFRPTLYL